MERALGCSLEAPEPGQLRVDLPVVVGQPQRAPQEETVPTNLHVLKSEFWKNMGTRHCRVRSTAKAPAELQKTEEEKACIDAARARLDAGRRPKNQGGAPAAAAAANAPVLVGASEPDAEVAELGTCKSERSFEAGAPGKARRKERRKTEEGIGRSCIRECRKQQEEKERSPSWGHSPLLEA